MTTTEIAPEKREAIPPEIMRLLRGSLAELERTDIARMNLLCAKGLPGTEHLDINYCLRRLDQMAEATKQVTQRDIFERYSGTWDNSWSIARVHAMICTLQRGFKVRYNPAKIPTHVPLDCNDSFLHGVLQGEGGVCTSMSVLLVAVGRRLGYPIKLVHVMGIKDGSHAFARWDEPGRERFNIEANNGSFETPHDEEYRRLPFNWRPEWEKAGIILKSKTPREELAGFLAERASCWWDEAKDARRMVETLIWACALTPHNLEHWCFLDKALKQWTEELRKRKPARFPPFRIRDWRKSYPRTIPDEIEKAIVSNKFTEFLLQDPINEERWWEPMRKGKSVRDWPSRVEAKCVGDGFRVRMLK